MGSFMKGKRRKIDLLVAEGLGKGCGGFLGFFY